ncbi:nodulation protein U [Mesorhizobium sp. L-8-10]|uniref:carbamoyltransferase C-terminal domain-containing protein n=1 Tax=Mesorhizobium sp. L-8-10 TaxID=2744523 RepID=UPI001938A8BC|nr:carbamoyltransferase C-terminal domain-containing protein [Mesorhizobium sp. L-8-10]BCH29252.1 nodulation protein U [Mesorhizobium sp. L-8-10]
MKIFAYKPGHDGHVALVQDGSLVFSIEAEKDSGDRYAPLSSENMLHGLSLVDGIPDVVAVSGWLRSFRPMSGPVGGGYFDAEGATIIDRPGRMLGRDIRSFSSSHERSHIIGSYAMSPFPQGQPCYALVWEGVIGAFYRIDADLKVTALGTPMSGPGHKYGFLYGLADPTYPADARKSRREDAGKLMALAAFGRDDAETPQERVLIDRILAHDAVAAPLRKADFAESSFFNIGLQTQAFRTLARRFQNAVFERFHDFARRNLRDGLPLLVSGGCGLNCDWNSAWHATGLFADVFVPPCANDSGSAIGTAADAQFAYTGNAKLEWSVYAGEEFVIDTGRPDGFEPERRDDAGIAGRLAAGDVLAWVQGRYEIGPRALGNRSLLAAPFTAETHARLNAIKRREAFRPIAPIMLEDELDRLFENHGPSPHMLYFQTAKTDALKAVTHVDGTARVQTVNRRQNAQIHELLTAFKRLTGYGVLCNTSLNFNGKGFINRLSDLARYARDTGLDGFVVGETFYRKV